MTVYFQIFSDRYFFKYFFNRYINFSWKNSNVKLYESVKPEDVTVKESLHELLYITLIHTDLLIYMTILINQVFDYLTI